MIQPVDKVTRNNSGQTTIEYILLITIAVAFFLGFNRIFSDRIKNHFENLAAYFTNDLQTGRGFFDGWNMKDSQKK